MKFSERLELDRERIIAANDNARHESVRSDYFGISNGGKFLPTIDIQASDGKRKGLPYLNMEFDYEPTEIVIVTANWKVTITGRDFEKIYHYLLEHKVRFIKPHEGGDFEECGLCVTEIKIDPVI